MEYIIKSISTYLNSPNPSGAFQISGKWGCGKTYFVKNILPTKIDKIQVMISMFGVNNVLEIPYRLLNAYINKMKEKGEDVTESMNQGLDYIDFKYGSIKSIMDIDLHDESEYIYKIIPKNDVYLCIDDVERFVKETNVEEFMGTINNLIENNGYRVILITNDSYIDNDIFFKFKEKVIWNTIGFVPDFHEVYRSIISEYEDEIFSTFMDKEIYPIIFGVENAKSKIKERLENIRNLKFALERFYPIFDYYKIDLDNDITKKKLYAYLAFVIGVSIDFKRSKLSETDCHGMDKYTEIFNLDLEEEPEKGNLSEGDIQAMFNGIQETIEEKNTREAKERADTIYSNWFYANYIKSVGQKAVFYKQIYYNIVKGSPINYEELDKVYEEQVASKEISENIGNQLVQQTLNGSFFDYSDNEAKDKMLEILHAVENSSLEQCLTYINAFSFLDIYKSVMGVSHEKLEQIFQKGIDGYITRAEIGQMEKSSIDMVKGSIPKGTRNLYKFLVNCINVKQKDERVKGMEEMIHLFETDIAAFCDLFGITTVNGGFKYYMEPVLQNIPQETVKKRMQTVNAKEVHLLTILINERYKPEDIFSFHLNKEQTFLSALLNGIEHLEGDDTITKVEAKIVLRYHIERALRYIDISK